MLGVGGCGPRGTHTPPMNRMTDRCKNITFPQLRLRAVINNGYYITVTFNPSATSTIKQPKYW